MPVQVEHRTTPSASFGKGDATKVDMPFSKVLQKVVLDGDSSLYMTTQPVAPGPDGHPELMAPPTLNLATDFPLQPSLLGNLVPQQINVWMGNSSAIQGATTGMHLDFHDNLYVLLYGRKKFRLFPPSVLQKMYLNGRAVKVHENGRVVFAGQGEVLADGSDAREVAVWAQKRAVELELEAAEEAVARGEEGAAARLAKAEEGLDAVLEAVLVQVDDEDNDFEGFDDFEALEMMDAARTATTTATASTGAAGEPDSFSKIDLSLPLATLRTEFPDFPGVDAAYEAEVQAGQMLYLPCGWFHEVTSFSETDDDDEERKFHLALNYWTHPPDVLDSTSSGFSQPYSSGYWPELWSRRKGRYAAMVAAAAAAAAAVVVKKKRKKEDVEEEEEDDVHECNDAACNHHHHHHGSGGGNGQEGYYIIEDEDEDGWRAPTKGEMAHFLKGVQGMYGYGRRQHLHRFVSLKLRGNV